MGSCTYGPKIGESKLGATAYLTIAQESRRLHLPPLGPVLS